jgi:hypothetical protein
LIIKEPLKEGRMRSRVLRSALVLLAASLVLFAAMAMRTTVAARGSTGGGEQFYNWTLSQHRDSKGPVTLEEGGPDDFGYYWTDHYPFKWEDISKIGEIVTWDNCDNQSYWHRWSESYGYTDPLYFYGMLWTDFYISQRGWLYLGDYNSGGPCNSHFEDYPDQYPAWSDDDPFFYSWGSPSQRGYGGFGIFPFANDQLPWDSGAVYYWADPWNDRVIVQFDKVAHKVDDGQWPTRPTDILYTYQMVMSSRDTTIEFRYKSAEAVGGPTLHTLWQDWYAAVGIEGDPYWSRYGQVVLPAIQGLIKDGYRIIYHMRWPHDVGVVAVEVPDVAYPEESESLWVIPTATVRNFGTKTEYNFDVVMEIYAHDLQLYRDVVRIDTLYPETIKDLTSSCYTTVSFDTFFAYKSMASLMPWFDVVCYTALRGDRDVYNDTLYKTVYKVPTYIWSSYTPTVPDIDGYIDDVEWGAAMTYDVSDILNRMGDKQFPTPEGSAILHVMNDSLFLYLGLVAIIDQVLETEGGDFLGFAFEDDHDKKWPCDTIGSPPDDSTEGILEFWTEYGPDLYWDYGFMDCNVLYSWLSAPHVDGAVGSDAGHVQWEVMIPLKIGGWPEGIEAEVNDTIGFAMMAADPSFLPPDTLTYAYWPQSVPPDSVYSARMLGNLILGQSERDVAVLEILEPEDTVFCCSTYSVSATITNLGRITENDLLVWASFGDEVYADTLTVYDLAPGDTVTVNFSPLTVPCIPDSTWYDMFVLAYLPPDRDQLNNARIKSVFAYNVSKLYHDLGVYQVISPCDSPAVGDTLPVECVVKDFGNMIEENFPVIFTITDCTELCTLYVDTEWVAGIFPGTTVNVEFDDWIVPAGAQLCLKTCFSTSAPVGDAEPTNDKNCCTMHIIGVEELIVSPAVPKVFGLGEARPNPVEGATRISYQLPEASNVELGVFDAGGRLIRVLVSGVEEPGYKQVNWDGRDGSGTEVSSGVYFYRLVAGGFKQTNKMVVVR